MGKLLEKRTVWTPSSFSNPQTRAMRGHNTVTVEGFAVRTQVLLRNRCSGFLSLLQRTNTQLQGYFWDIILAQTRLLLLASQPRGTNVGMSKLHMGTEETQRLSFEDMTLWSSEKDNIEPQHLSQRWISEKPENLKIFFHHRPDRLLNAIRGILFPNSLAGQMYVNTSLLGRMGLSGACYNNFFFICCFVGDRISLCSPGCSETLF